MDWVVAHKRLLGALWDSAMEGDEGEAYVRSEREKEEEEEEEKEEEESAKTPGLRSRERRG